MSEGAAAGPLTMEAARHGARAAGCAALHGRITASRQRLWFLGADDLTPDLGGGFERRVMIGVVGTKFKWCQLVPELDV